MFLIVTPALAALPGQDAGASIRLANGSEGARQELRVIHAVCPARSVDDASLVRRVLLQATGDADARDVWTLQPDPASDDQPWKLFVKSQSRPAGVLPA
ncbi:MAG TPA: hypothetical protein VJQ42_09075 [Rhodanobacteraceae bacterium]|nr:hypothetical protein [Rhodanobacteraceae bacterium]